jgi:nucleoside-diphosphate-sugar epimerase
MNRVTRRSLVTGGAGFIGSHLVEALVKRGDKVRVLDNFSTGKRDNLTPFQNQIELIEGDLRSYHIVREAVQGVDCVFHKGALPSVPRSINDPITTNEVNVGGTLNVLDASKEAGVRRIVYASSSSVYGANPDLPKHEDATLKPISPYAVSKLAGERYCHVFSTTYGLETVALRYFNVFGPRQDSRSGYAAFIPKFVIGLLLGTPLVIDGDGEQSRDFTYVDNVIKANLLASQVEGVSGKVFNIACGRSMSLNEVVKSLQMMSDQQGQISYGPPRPGDVPASLADISQARDELGYIPEITAEKGLGKVMKWYREMALRS